jgi:hypothetical protein
MIPWGNIRANLDGGRGAPRQPRQIQRLPGSVNLNRPLQGLHQEQRSLR